MKPNEVQYLRCPECFKPLTLANDMLICECEKKYPIHNGIPNLLVTTDKRTLSELQGWVQRAKEKGWYDVTDDYLNSLPYPAQSNEEINWKLHADSFYFMLKKLDLKGKRVLDVGAGKPWSTRDLALAGAEAVALELFDDDRIGLGVGDVYMKKHNIYFERIIGDMNNIPYADESFDVVFYQGALHHSMYLNQAMDEADRVLKKGGLLVFGREGSGGILSREWVGPCPDGVNEHNYKNLHYIWNLWGLGYDYKVYNEPDQAQTGFKAWLRHMWTYCRGGPLLLIARKPSRGKDEALPD